MNNGSSQTPAVVERKSEINIYKTLYRLKGEQERREAREKAERAIFTAEKLPRLLDEFSRIFKGTNPALIPGKGRTKFEPIVKWTQLSDSELVSDQYLMKLGQCIRDDGNIAIVLGPKSGDLVTIDIDADELVEPFLKANPRFRETFRTFGSKGRNFGLSVLAITRKRSRC